MKAKDRSLGGQLARLISRIHVVTHELFAELIEILFFFLLSLECSTNESFPYFPFILLGSSARLDRRYFSVPNSLTIGKFKVYVNHPYVAIDS
jgi:hypothetical protein